MNLFRLLQTNRLFIHYLTIVIVIMGFFVISKMQREARPNVNFNRVAVSVAYPGASPSDVEDLVIDPIEEKISEVDGIEEYRSVSFSGAGSISIVIDDEYPDPEEVVDEIRRKISEIKDLPIEVDDPIVTEIKASNIPVLKLALYGNLDPLNMKLEVEKLKDYLKHFSRVQSVSYTGIEDLQLQILADSSKLDKYFITLTDLMNQLKLWSRQLSGGLLENSLETSNLTVGSDLGDIAKLESLIIRSNFSGNYVKLSDVANVEFATEETQNKNLYGDNNAVLITIIKKPFADIVNTVEEVKAGLKDYARNLPEGLEYELYTDESKRVQNRLAVVTFNAEFGLILVLILLIVFLDWRSALVTSAGIPIALLGGVIIIYLTGNTMNSLTLVGVIIVLGMLVDDATVVCENIYHELESGNSPLEAAIKGVSNIAMPVVATVLTTIFAFLPIVFMKDIMGQFLRVIPITVISLLLFSLFEALIILPIHCSEIMKPRKKKESHFTRIENAYKRYIRWSFNHKKIVNIILIIIFVLSMVQGKSLFDKFTLFPATGLEGLSIRVELKKNTPIKKTTEEIKKLNTMLKKVSEGTFDSLYSSVGETTTGGSSGSRQFASHLGMVSIVFTTDPSFMEIEERIVANIRKVTNEFSKETGIKTSITIDRPGPPIGKPIQFEIATRDLEHGSQIADNIKAELNKISGINSIETDLDGDSKRIRFLIDNSLAVSEGFSPATIAQTIYAATTGRVINEILKNNEKVEIMVSLDGKHEQNIESILNLKLPHASGSVSPLGTFTNSNVEYGPSSIQRLNGLRTITLFAEVDENIISGKEANEQIAPFIEKLKQDNLNVQIETGGGEKDRIEALKDTMRLYLIAIILIFMTISLSFRSVLYPFLVLLSIPMGLCGVVWALTLHGQPLSIMGIIGIVGLSGVVVNVSIILLQYIQEKIKEGLSLDDAVVEAGTRRLRPIIITTLTTLIGLAPTIYGLGGFDSFVQPIALVLGWGLFVSTILTIFALPALLSSVTVLNKLK